MYCLISCCIHPIIIIIRAKLIPHPRIIINTYIIVLTRCLDDTIITKNSDYSGFSRKHAASLKEIQKMKDDPEIQKELNKVYTFQPSTENFEDTLLDPLPEHLKPDDDSAK